MCLQCVMLAPGPNIGIRTLCLSHILQPFPLAHGLLAANHYGIGIVDCVRRSQKSPRPAKLSSCSAEIEQWDRLD